MKFSVQSRRLLSVLERRASLQRRQLQLSHVVESQALAEVSHQSKWSYVCGPGHPPLLPHTIGQVVDIAAEKYGDREALVVTQQEVRRTYVTVKQEVESLAAGLLELGLQPGDRIGIWGPNTHEWYLTQFAAAKAGLILVNINPAYQPEELRYCLNKVGVKGLVAASSFKTQNYYELLSSIAPEIKSSSAGGIQCPDIPSLKTVIMMSQQEQPGTFKFDDILNNPSPALLERVEGLTHRIQMDQAANIQFTSGTTGKPKGVTLSHHNLVNNAYNIGVRMGYDQEPHRVCVSVPFYHCFGNVCATLGGLIHGATSVVPCPSFNGAACVAAIESEKCTSIYGTPTMFVDMLDAARRTKPDVSHVRTGIMAGAPCPEELCRNVINELNMKDFVVCYGMTETSPVTFQGFTTDPMHLKTGTVGYPSNHQEMAIMDTEGKIVEAGVEGELVTRGYSTMLGYWEDHEKTAEAITPDRWFHTGDVAVIEENGYGRIVGRMKDMIIRGGENIYPREIEEFLHTHPAIMEAQAFGVRDERMGEELCAWIKLNAGHSLQEEEIRSFCKGNISHFKIPRYFSFVTEFPTTVTGKIQKFVMREVMENKIKEGQL